MASTELAHCVGTLRRGVHHYPLTGAQVQESSKGHSAWGMGSTQGASRTAGITFLEL